MASRRRDFQSILDVNVSSGRRRCPHHTLPYNPPVIVKEKDPRVTSPIPITTSTAQKQVTFVIEQYSRYPNLDPSATIIHRPIVINANHRCSLHDHPEVEKSRVSEAAKGSNQRIRSVHDPSEDDHRNALDVRERPCRKCPLHQHVAERNQASGIMEGNAQQIIPFDEPSNNTRHKGLDAVNRGHNCCVHDPAGFENSRTEESAQQTRPVDEIPENNPGRVSNATKVHHECRIHCPDITEDSSDTENPSPRLAEENPQVIDAHPNPTPNKQTHAVGTPEGTRRHTLAELPIIEQSQIPRIIEGKADARATPSFTNKIVLQIDGTRIFQTTNPSITLYQLSHPITWKSDDAFEGVTLSTMAQIPYIPSIFAGPHRICDIQILDKVYNYHDAYPEATIQSPPWGLKPSFLKFFYKERGRMMGVCETEEMREKHTRHNRHRPPSLLLAAGVFETENAVEQPKLDYPHGEYRVQWLQCRQERVMAVEMCDLVEGENRRLKRRYRIAWNRTKIPFKEDVDLLVASWCTRVWMEEVYMRVMRISRKEFIEGRARKSFRFRKSISVFSKWEEVGAPVSAFDEVVC